LNLSKKLTSFAGLLLASLCFVALLHIAFLYVRKIPVPIDQMVLGYLINMAMALGIYYIMLRFAAKKSKNLGFLFLFGSTLKFLVYFLIFDPLFKQDGSLSRIEFFVFFIPYFACLITETIALVKLLKALDE